MPKLSLLGLGCIFLVSAWLPQPAVAADCAPWVARLVSVEGRVDVRRYRAGQWSPVQMGQQYCLGDRIRVGTEARASVELNNDTILRLDQQSTLVLPEPKEQQTSFVELIKGALHLISRVKGKLEIRTPFVNAGLEGTEFVVRVDATQTQVSVIEGRVAVSNPYGSLKLLGGQTATAGRDSAPQLRLDLKPEDAVHWAIHYPLTAETQTTGLAAETIVAQRQLRVGRVEQAQQTIDRVLASEAENSEALALASVIALAQNRKTDAMALARQATANQASATAFLALSYAQQASFDLHSALQTIEQAVARFPQLGLLWSRQAELLASLGRGDEAQSAAKQAVDLDPDVSRTQSVLGFAALGENNADQALAAFHRAIALDAADPLPRLGLGLARIRQGDLAKGRRQMEIAVSLDPANSLVRSYLGKAYLEEGRNDEAAVEFALARQLDPKDPTPWLYDALLHRTDNRPVASLRALEQSIALNDNRAVYRSSLQLDADRAVRNAGIGATYAQLGLGDLARRHAARSLSSAQDNAAAHALLADAYRSVPRRGITRLSEQLQTQLLQPLTAQPYRPSQLRREPDPGQGLGRLGMGYGEFSSVFEDQTPQFGLSAMLGENGMSGFELTHSQRLDDVSYGLGFHRFDTEGFRPNADLTEEVYNLFAQAAISDGLAVQFEARNTEKDQGALTLDPRPSANDERRSLNAVLFRLGGRLEINDNALLLLSIARGDRDEDLTAPVNFLGFFPGTNNVQDERRALVSEAQLLHRRGDVQFRIGGSLRRTQLDKVTTLTVPGLFLTTVSPESHRIRSSTFYAYADWQVSPDLIVTLGASYDDHKDPSTGTMIEFSRLNPKLGVQWQALPWLNLRAAHSATTKHQLVVEETIEPTQIAGFAQFYDDFNRTEAELNALGVDLKLTESLFATTEVIDRDSHEVRGSNSLDETQFRVSLSAILDQQWVATLGLQRQKDEFAGASVFDLTTDTIPLSLRYEGHQGFFGRLDWSWFDQALRPAGAARIDTRFNAVDITAGYRWNKGRNRITLGVDDLLDDVEVYRDDGFKVNDAFNVYRPFLPGRTIWAGVEISLD